ncbi:hypothetical protein ACFX2G_013225 [Malus domestica]
MSGEHQTSTKIKDDERGYKQADTTTRLSVSPTTATTTQGGQGRPSLFRTCTNEDGGLSTQTRSHISGQPTDARKSAEELADLGTQDQRQNWKASLNCLTRAKIGKASQLPESKSPERQEMDSRESDSKMTEQQPNSEPNSQPRNNAQASAAATLGDKIAYLAAATKLPPSARRTTQQNPI